MNEYAPRGLATAGQVLWRKVVSLYSLRPDELATLEDVCRLTDMIDKLQKAWREDDEPMTAKGSAGQLIIHPIIGELRAQRLAVNVLWRQLKLPDLDDAAEAPNQHRAAVNTRYARGKAS